MCVKHLAQCLAQTKCPINVSHEEMLKDNSDSRDPTLTNVVSARTTGRSIASVQKGVDCACLLVDYEWSGLLTCLYCLLGFFLESVNCL